MEYNDTKNNISNTFIRLLEEKAIDQITVIELAKESGVSRQTFYYHFHDLTAVIEWLVHDRTQAILNQALAKENYQAGLRHFLFQVESVALHIKKLLHSDRRDEVEKLLFVSINELVRAIFQEQKLNQKLTDQSSDFDFGVNFCSYGIVGTLLHYLNTDSYTLDTIEDIFNEIMIILNQVSKMK